MALDLRLFGDGHVARYQETDGEDGYLWNGVPILLLTTTRPATGATKTVPLIFAEDGECFVVVASRGGSPVHPRWYQDLAADPNVEVQVKAERFAARASTAEGDERARLWTLVNEQWPSYERYQDATDRVIPVVVLERV